MSAKLFRQAENVALISYADLLAGGADKLAQATMSLDPTPPKSWLPGGNQTAAQIQDSDGLTTAEAEAVLISQASAEAEQIVAAAHDRAAAIEHEARERGLAQSSAQAVAAATQQLEPVLQKLAQTINEIAHLRTTIVEHVEHDLLRLALEIARKVVQREATVDREIALALTRIALSKLHHRALAVVRLHPEDCVYVRANCERLGTGSAVEIIEDLTIARGGCLVETEMGDVDARIEQQFAEIEQGFLEA